MDEDKVLRDTVRKYSEEEISRRKAVLEKAMEKAAKIISDSPSIDTPTSIYDKDVDILLVGSRCVIIEYRGHYFLHNGSDCFAPFLSYEEALNEYCQVEGNRG